MHSTGTGHGWSDGDWRRHGSPTAGRPRRLIRHHHRGNEVSFSCGGRERRFARRGIGGQFFILTRRREGHGGGASSVVTPVEICSEIIAAPGRKLLHLCSDTVTGTSCADGSSASRCKLFIRAARGTVHRVYLLRTQSSFSNFSR